MTTSAHDSFNSLLSLKPLVSVLKKMIAEGKPGARQLYQGLLTDIESKPELLAPMQDADRLLPHNELVETLLSTIFPPSTSANEGMFAVCFPFRSETVFASAPFRHQFLSDDSRQIRTPDGETALTITKASLNLAYDLILRKFYGWDLSAITSSVHQFTDADKGLTKYLELKMNAQFVDVKLVNKEFTLPASYTVQRSLDVADLQETFPIEHFQFEGLVVIDVTDVTSEQVILEIKNNLLNTNAFNDGSVFDSLQQNIQTFLGAPDVSVGITPFFKINGYHHFSEVHYKHSILFKNERVQADKRGISELCQQLFKDAAQPFLFQTVSAQVSSRIDLMTYYYEQGTRSLILCPLKCDDGSLIGLLEICSNEPGRLKYKHLSRIQSAVQVFTLALEKNLESLDLQIDKTIKEHFTSIQPAVEWKFTEAAFDFLQNRQVSESATLPSIAFDEVYPLYAAIDIKNSSQERNNSIQKDLLEQLHLAHAVLAKANTKGEFPLLKEIKYKLEKYIAASTDSLLSEDEMMIYEFLQHDIEALFRHLQDTRTDLAEPIKVYFGALDPQKKILYRHRKQYEDSVTKINAPAFESQTSYFIPAVRVKRHDGLYRWHTFKGNPRYKADGAFNGYVGVGFDIHEQKLAEESLKQSEENLQQKVAERTAELERTVEELQRSNANLEEFAYAASHDLKEPIRKIQVFSDRLKSRLENKLEADDRTFFERMELATRRMSTLIDDLLQYSHISRGALLEEGVDLNHKLRMVLEDLDMEIEDKGAKVVVDPLPIIKGHRRQLQQLFQNLIGNALKYARPGVPPEVRVSSRLLTNDDNALLQSRNLEGGSYHLLEVADNGIGFDPADADRIFNVFTRLHGLAEYKGTGVGLSIVRKVVENHKGQIWAESSPGQGSTFRLLMPA